MVHYVNVFSGCVEGEIRLVGSASVYEGRVEVCHNKTWGTVCDDGWGINEGIVTCRQLGYKYERMRFYGQGAGQIWLDDLSCSGSESRIVDCSHNGFGVNDCSHSEDAGVVCYG